jgi:hypothetical protein
MEAFSKTVLQKLSQAQQMMTSYCDRVSFHPYLRLSLTTTEKSVLGGVTNQWNINISD